MEQNGTNCIHKFWLKLKPEFIQLLDLPPDTYTCDTTQFNALINLIYDFRLAYFISKRDHKTFDTTLSALNPQTYNSQLFSCIKNNPELKNNIIKFATTLAQPTICDYSVINADSAKYLLFVENIVDSPDFHGIYTTIPLDLCNKTGKFNCDSLKTGHYIIKPS